MDDNLLPHDNLIPHDQLINHSSKWYELPGPSRRAAYWAELAEVTTIGAPVGFTLLARFLTDFTDLSILGEESTLFRSSDSNPNPGPTSGHLGTDELASCSYSLIWINLTTSLVWRGFGGAINTLCSQAYGASNMKLMGEWAQLGMACIVVTCIPIGASWFAIPHMLAAVGVEPSIVRLAGQFSRISVIWLLPRVLTTLMQSFFQAQKIAKPFAVIAFVVLVLNLGTNFALVHGLPGSGFRGFGFVGSPMATVIARSTQCLLIFFYCFIYRGLHRAACPPPGSGDEVCSSSFRVCYNEEAYSWARLRQFLNLAMPLMLSAALEADLTCLSSLSSLSSPALHDPPLVLRSACSSSFRASRRGWVPPKSRHTMLCSIYSSSSLASCMASATQSRSVLAITLAMANPVRRVSARF